TLQSLSLVIQLGHPLGQRCGYGHVGHKDFVVIHTNGIHQVTLWFCSCGRKPALKWTQLLRASWWPATPLNPQTCAMIQVLRQFQMINLQGKLSVYDFYRTLELQTDGTGLLKVPVSLTVLNIPVDRFLIFVLGSNAIILSNGEGVPPYLNGEKGG
ncbi:hypothetical protein JAAARDRAFT_137762, partial [Jaapia argillacea MUCL 33604]